MTQPRKGGVIVTPNPYVWQSPDSAGMVIRVSFAWTAGTRALSGITAFRDADCQFARIIIGVGPDGTPDTSTKVISVPAGTTVLSAQALALLASAGLGTIDAVLALQMTAAE